MTQLLAWLPAFGPLALVAAGFAATSSRRTSTGVRAGLAGASLALAAALACAVALLARGGELCASGPGVAGIGTGVLFDALTAVISVLVAFIGLAVIAYSRNYLAGNPRQAYFTRWLCFTLAAVLTLIVSGNMAQLAAAWVATSLCLHRLLLFYPGRPAAQLAARKKFITSRMGDLCLLLALALLHRAFGTLDLRAVLDAASAVRAAGAGVPPGLHLAAALIVGSALLKSAQFPFHGWLSEVMETPTPVSALLHAGIINAGGFLVIRLSPVLLLSTPALDALAVIGGLTALFASVVMLTQTSIKVSLAWSTMAQMGFMLLQCGLGAFPAAALHLVAHSLYKAHAFLASGSVLDLARAAWVPAPGSRLHPVRLVAALAVAAAITAVAGAAVPSHLGHAPGVVVLAAVLAMGLAHLIAASMEGQPSVGVIGRSVARAAWVALAYFALQLGAERLLAEAVPPNAALRGPAELGIAALAIASFGAVIVLQSLKPARAGAPAWQAAYVHLQNGLYVNAVTNRIVARLWPAAPGTGGAQA